MNKTVALIFNSEVLTPEISVAHGTLCGIKQESKSRYDVDIGDAALEIGAYQTRVTVRTKKLGFSFFLRDVNAKAPIYIKDYGVIVTEQEDKRDFNKIVADIASLGGKSKMEEIEEAPETCFDTATKGLRELKSYTWLGLSRDIRLFEIRVRDYCAEMADVIYPRTFYAYTTDPDTKCQLGYHFMMGRGIGCESNVKRRLEKGTLPILNQTCIDNDIEYEAKYFVTPDKLPYDEKHLRGTDFLAADGYGAGRMLTDEQQEKANALFEEDCKKSSLPILFVRISAKNTSKAPRYSFVRLPNQDGGGYNSVTGKGTLGEKVWMVATHKGKPIVDYEMSVLLQPGEEIEYVFIFPHTPVTNEKADYLLTLDWKKHYNACKNFWEKRLKESSPIHVPEKRIDEMIHAGLLHTDLIYFGHHNAPVVPAIGVYTAIGSESSSCIQFLDSMSNNSLAERALDYFLEKQHEDGRFQNFGGYMLETGYGLWSIGQHYLYTHDDAWAKRVAPKVIAACEYNVRWREQNLDESLRKNGYGMISGKVADPNDFFHSFMLNSGTYAGFTGAAELLKNVEPEYAEKYRLLAIEYKQNILDSLEESLVQAPVVPLGNGSWIPSFAPWTENPGSVMFHAEGGLWYSHGSCSIRDILGPEYLPLHGILDAKSEMGKLLTEFWAEYMCARNVAFSQPYYSPHPYANLIRGEIKPFLCEFYNNFAALADRDTYSFWEHFFHASPHKLHEEGWFLMRCRWMLWVEDGSELRLLGGIPRAWMKDGKTISVNEVRSTYGILSFNVKSLIKQNKIVAHIRFEKTDKQMKTIAIRLPYPADGVTAVNTNIGKYDKERECVIIDCPNTISEFDVELKF